MVYYVGISLYVRYKKKQSAFFKVSIKQFTKLEIHPLLMTKKVEIGKMFM